MSVCQPCPASASPIGLPFSTMLERIITSGIPGSWNALATLISSFPKRALKSASCRPVSSCRGKRTTPNRPRARSTASNSSCDSGCARSSPATVAPRVSPLVVTFIGGPSAAVDSTPTARGGAQRPLLQLPGAWSAPPEEEKMDFPKFQTVKVEVADDLAWVTMNRPDKRNAMSPQMHEEMIAALSQLAVAPEAKALVLTGAGESWSAGQDIELFFRNLDDKPLEKRRAILASQEWRWNQLAHFPKPTIAMVNGFCYGAAFTPLVACDFAIAAEDAKFGLSEINWGILPGGLVAKVMLDACSYRDAKWYALTGEPVAGRVAAQIRLVNFAVPRAKLREETVKLAKMLLAKNPQVYKSVKEVMHHVRGMDVEQATDYLKAKEMEMRFLDREQGRTQGMKQFLDEKAYRPGLETYKRG